MKRKPKSEKGNLTRELILKGAAQIVLKEGVEALNTNRVAEKAGVSVGSLYQYYDNKEEILLELLMNAVDRRIQKVKDAVTVSMAFQSTESIVDKIVDSLFEASDAHDARLEFLLFPLAISGQSKVALEMVQKSVQTIHPLLQLLLVTKEPGLKNRSLEAVSFILSQSARAVLIGRTLPHGKNLKEEDLKKELKNLFLGMVKLR